MMEVDDQCSSKEIEWFLRTCVVCLSAYYKSIVSLPAETTGYRLKSI